MRTRTYPDRTNRDGVFLARESDSLDDEVMSPIETDSDLEIDNGIQRKTIETFEVDLSGNEYSLIRRSRCGRS
jgi:hypothetical protein